MAKTVNLYARIEPDIKEQAERPIDINELTDEQLREELAKGYADMLAGRTKPAKEVFASIRKDYNI